jgi:hypothetical protein
MANGDIFGQATNALLQGYLRNKQLDLQQQRLNIAKQSENRIENSVEINNFVRLLSQLPPDTQTLLMRQHPLIKNNEGLKKSLQDSFDRQQDIQSTISSFYSMRSLDALGAARNFLANPEINKFLSQQNREEISAIIKDNEARARVTVSELEASPEAIQMTKLANENMQLMNDPGNLYLQSVYPDRDIKKLKDSEVIQLRNDLIKQNKDSYDSLFQEAYKQSGDIGPFNTDDSKLPPPPPQSPPPPPPPGAESSSVKGTLSDASLSTDKEAREIFLGMFDPDDEPAEAPTRFTKGNIPRDVRELMNTGLSLQEATMQAQARQQRGIESRQRLSEGLGRGVKAITEDLPDALGVQKAREFFGLPTVPMTRR